MNKLQAMYQAYYATIILWLCSTIKRVKSYWIFKKFFRNRKAAGVGALALVVMLIMFGIVLMVGLYVQASLFETASVLLNETGKANETFTNLKSNVWAAYDLTVIIPIVAAAGAVIATVVGYLAYRRGF